MRPNQLLRLAAALGALAAPAFAQTAEPLLTESNARIQAAVDAGHAAATAGDRGRIHDALAARKAMLLNVFRDHPASARAYALPAATRQALLAADPEAAPLLESERTATGELSASVADRWTDRTSTTLYTLHTATAELELALPAAVLASAPANHHLGTVRGLALGNLVAADTLTEATPADAAACASPVTSRTASVPGAASASATTSAGTAPLTCSTVGNQRVAVLIVKFPAATPAFPAGLDQPAYWNQVLFGANPSVNTYLQEVSGGQSYATGDVYGPLQLGSQYDCTTTAALATAAIAAAAATVDFAQYNRVLIVYPAATCTFGGLANVGCVGATSSIAHQYSVAWLPVLPTYKADFSSPQMWGGVSHEFGHNLGLNHANTLDFSAISLGPLDFSTTNPGTGASTGTGSNLAAVNAEYGDNFDVMGYPWNAGGPYNAVHRAQTLGWIPAVDEREVTTSGTFTILPAESSAGLRALHVLRDPTSSSWLWVEYHQPAGYYQSGNFSAHINDGDTETTGAQIHYEAPLGANAYTYLLDMTPAVSAAGNNFYDGTLAPGRGWSDPYSPLTLTAGAQTSSGLDITVSYDTPCATLALSANTVLVPTGGSGSLLITAPASCAWTAGSNAPWISFPGTTSGSGSGVVRFTASYNTSGAQRNTYLTAQRQSIPLVQPAFSTTFAGIAPNRGSSVAGTPTSFAITYADTFGPFDTTEVNLVFTGFATPDCQVTVVINGGKPYLYLLTNGAFTSGIAMGSAATLASPTCSVSGAGSSFITSGNTVTLVLSVTFSANFPGAHNILVNALGSSANTASLPLGVWTVTSQALLASSTALAVSPSSARAGGTVTLAATVSPAAATGTVSFLYSAAANGTGAVSLGYAALVNGSATLSITALPSGADYLFATYPGDTAYSQSSSSIVPLAVGGLVGTSTTLGVSSAGILPSGSVTLSANVVPSSGTAPATGSVTFLDGSNALATLTLQAGTATYTASGLALGTHTLGAAYAGSATMAASSAGPVTVLVARAPATLSLTTGAGVIFPNGSVAIAATAASTSGLSPAGSIAFTDGSATLATVALLNGSAAFTATGLPAGPHALGAVLLPTGDFASATSPQVQLAVQDFSLALPNPSATTDAGTAVFVPLTLTPGAAGFTSPIALTCTGAPAQAACSVSPTILAPGASPATATVTLTSTARPTPAAGWLLLGLSPALLASGRRKRRRGPACLLAVCALLCFASGCGQGNFAATSAASGTPAGTCTLTLSGTATGATVLTHSITLSIRIN